METSQMMMKTTFLLLLLFSLCNPRNAAGCSLLDLAVTQIVVSSEARVYAVTVENRCICMQANVKLACRGFMSTVRIDDDLLRRDDGDAMLCILNGGRPIFMGPEYAVKFSYVSRSPFVFKPVSSSIACSR